MVNVTVALENVVFVRVALVPLVYVRVALVPLVLVMDALVALDVRVAVVVIVWLVLVMDALVAVSVPVVVVVMEVEFVSVKLVVVLEAVVVVVGQPVPSCLQHQTNFAADHPAAIFLAPAEQLKGNVVRLVVVETLVSVPDVSVMAVSDDVTVRVDVSVGVDVPVKVDVLVTVVSVGLHPTPMAEQQNSRFSCDQLDGWARPDEQLYSRGMFARRTCVLIAPAFPARCSEVEVVVALVALDGEVEVVVALVAPAPARWSASGCLPAPFGLGVLVVVLVLCALTQDCLA
mmetsp:Transcript_47268/g.107819  ORF Transcript_47268/g.107819 Transcript_47268/m.107819 type:complete len:288 (-) Transcript_47268:730-1593(-)